MAYHHSPQDIKAPDIKSPMKTLSGNITGMDKWLSVTVSPISINSLYTSLKSTLSEIDFTSTDDTQKIVLIDWREEVFNFFIRLLTHREKLLWGIIENFGEKIDQNWDVNEENLCNVIRTPLDNSQINNYIDPPFEVFISISEKFPKIEQKALNDFINGVHQLDKKVDKKIAKEFKGFLKSDDDLIKEFLLPIATNAIGTLLAAAIIAILEKRRGKKPFFWFNNRAKIERIVCSRPPLTGKNHNRILDLQETAKLLKCSTDDIKFLIKIRKIKSVVGSPGIPYQIKYGELVKLQRKYYRR